MKTPPIRLAFGSLFWRAFLVLAVAMEVGLWFRLKPFLAGRDTGFRVAAMILHSPSRICRAFLIAAIFTVLVDLYVRLIMRPLMARQYSPKGDDDAFGSSLAFRLASNERVRAEAPARLALGRRLLPGRLVATDRRVWFAPHAWDAEPWSIALDDLAEVRPEPAPARFGSLVIGLPERLVFESADGTRTTLVVADPAEALAWFPDHATIAEAEYEPSPLQLL